MTPLISLLIERISRNGPLTIAEFMADCLLHPEHGYYATRDPFGARGDFTTAPEISQMFGELLGLCLAQSWLDQGAPTPFLLAEIGPGRGTLMADILRVTRSVSGFHAAAEIHLIEASSTLRERQRETLSEHRVDWHDTISTLPDAPLFLLANEFFDALPIRQFIRSGNGWRERRVGIEKGQLVLGAGEAVPVPGLNHRLSDTKEGDLVEHCAAAAAITSEIASRIAGNGGAALIVDYGDWHSLGDTLQALKNHAVDPVLANPGEADLTAHVDFETLANAAQGACVTKITTQGVLLERLGITVRAQTIAKNLTGDSLKSHIAAHRRLTHPQEMGTLFKAISIYPKGCKPPPGFDL
ncbi:class I SAM-dependent methyltransferase [Pseudohalocynthiibacter aestuariivivens]|jgi:NADH dehydrogenase [ubiquinone] 1 alpha subcomplex assembly factor 7|uniref:Class I SAM-dependent methyltransferase n=1 Tax=Pseudohalocynthiibacter aestuariivivens TaxID=1591409 RepID=A0ABV5JCZ3_9RHOB|nr:MULTISPECIES: SAM-dependent methyltransferase [Pseudohalocynthiibacter]MBS9717181.1 SAM-dependent methyltransferase [Pseudohalocynthiibacter aestuariivivens]MCK0103716.1 SAM-dependent methyltransferase [Pseudohalocynthiibacter sp. F2068]